VVLLNFLHKKMLSPLVAGDRERERDSSNVLGCY